MFTHFGKVVQWKCVTIFYDAETRAKQSAIWDSGLVVEHVRGTFDRPAFKVILASFGATGNSKKYDFQMLFLLHL